MGFKKLVYFMLSMIRESTQNALERFLGKTGEDTHMSQQAFSLARQKIKWQAFRKMFDHVVEACYSEEDEIERWNGCRLSAVDGSQYALPNDEPLRKYFGTSGKGGTSPTGQGSMLYDILNDIVMDARIEPMSCDERELAMRHVKRLCRMESFREWKELIVFDRGYPSYDLIRGLLERKIHYVMRVREKFSTAIDALGLGDHRVELVQGTERTPVRVLKFPLPSGIIETLVTDIRDTAYGAEAFKELYFKRWPVETKYDMLKKKLEIENFSGRLVDNIRQDFFATMVLTNLATDLSGEAQEIMNKG
jgi:hypothetical protein